MKNHKTDEVLEEEVGRLITGNMHVLDPNEVLDQSKKAEYEYAEMKRKVIAQKLVLSLNIIYMFCDALRIMLSNKHANIKIKNIDKVTQVRKELRTLDDRLVHMVYSNMNDKEVGMLEYREKTGVITTTLSEQETQEEYYRNSVFADVLKGAVDKLLNGIENQDSNQIMHRKAEIREEIIRFPDCDDKERYAKWLDSVSSKISETLVNNCKKRIDSFLQIKNRIKTGLGKSSEKLPLSTLDSLATAEMLYEQYPHVPIKRLRIPKSP